MNLWGMFLALGLLFALVGAIILTVGYTIQDNFADGSPKWLRGAVVIRRGYLILGTGITCLVLCILSGTFIPHWPNG